MLLEELAILLIEPLDHVGPDCLVEHCRGTDLHCAASKREVARCLRHVGDATDSRKLAIGESLCQLRHLRESHRQDGRTTEPATRYEAIDVDLGLESLRVDQWQRRAGVP